MTASISPGTHGRYDSPDGRTTYEWALPAWTDGDRLLCRTGLHVATRKRVVWGWVGYFSQVERFYCACGARCWVRYEGHFQKADETEPGGHLAWVERSIRMTERMADNRAHERSMSESHPCWGKPYACISCGCNADRPCVSHVGGRRWNA